MARHNRRRVNPSRHRSARYQSCSSSRLSAAATWVGLASCCLSLLIGACKPAATNFLLAIVCLCVCVCVWQELMPNRIYIREPPFSCCFYCSCCDKCYRCLSLSLVAFSFSGFTHQFNWKASAGLSLPHFVICLLAICHFFSLSSQAAASSWLFN